MFFKKHKEKILLKLLDMNIPDEKDRDVILYQIDKKGINALKKELYQIKKEDGKFD